MDGNETMPTMFRWYLNRRWAHEARANTIAQVDLGLIVFGVMLAMLID